MFSCELDTLLHEQCPVFIPQLIIHFDGRGFDLSAVWMKGEMKNDFLTSLPGVYECQNVSFKPYYGSATTKKC